MARIAANSPVSILLADVVAPMDGPPIARAGVAYSDGTILAIGLRDDLLARFNGGRVDDLGPAVLMPGLVNAHVHLELSALNRGEPPASFVEWLKRLIPRRPVEAKILNEFVERSIRIGVEQSLRFGVTTVGDISRNCAITRSLLRRGPLRVVSFGEVAAMAQRRVLLNERLAEAVDNADASSHLTIGISPHAPYSVEVEGYRRCIATARDGNLPLATHLAETADEALFLSDHAGPFRELWDDLHAWDDAVPRFVGGPIRMAREVGLLDIPALLAHVNYCDDTELRLLAAGRASVVYCPRTHAYFSHPPHRWRQMLAAGINVAVGTDSCASSPDLNLVDDLRLMHEIAPQVPAVELWRMATIRGAQALGMEHRVGSLTAAKAADFVAFPAVGENSLTGILAQGNQPLNTWIGGVRL